MALKLQLEPGEKILLRGSSVRHGFWSAYTDELVLTNKALIHVDLGLFGNHHETVRYSFDRVTQVVIGEASNGEKQLELYYPDGEEDFAFQSGNDRQLKVWELAINDQMTGKGERFDASYYNDLLESADKSEVAHQISELTGGIDASFVGDVAKSMISSGNISVGGLVKGVKRASKKQAFAKAESGIMGGLGFDMDDDDVRQSQRVPSTFNEKMDYARRIRQQMDAEEEPEKVRPSDSMSLQDQVDTLKKLKELLDAGVLSQDEFNLKKQQIMGM